VLALVTLTKLFECLSDTLYGLAQQHERMEKIAVSRILKGVFQLAAFTVVLFFTRRLTWALLGMAAAAGLVLALYDVPFAVALLGRDRSPPGSALSGLARLRPRWSAAILVRLGRTTLPLGLVATFWNLTLQIPRYAVEYSQGARSLAIFSAMAYMMTIASDSLIGSLVQSVSPRLASLYLQDQSAFKRFLTQLLGLSAAAGLAGVLCAGLWGRPILTLVYSREYADRPVVFLWMMGAIGLSGMLYVLEAGLLASRNFDIQIPLGIVVILVSAAGCFALAPRYGLLGATWGMILGMMARFLGYGLLLTRDLVDRRRVLAPGFRTVEHDALGSVP
jgi:O-antigen/teichoic acid export membrane protein